MVELEATQGITSLGQPSSLPLLGKVQSPCPASMGQGKR